MRLIPFILRTSENEEVIELVPVHDNYELLCGTKLELKIIPKTANPNGPTKVTIMAENVDISFESAAQSVEYTLVIAPVAKLEVVSEKTTFKIGDGPSMFGVAAYDADNNEFDTLDGVQLSWFVGAKRDISRFQGSQSGPVVNIEWTGSGKATVICVINDQYYESLGPATMEVSVSATLSLEPDGVYLLAGGEANISLFESVDGAKSLISWDATDYTVTSREEDIAKVDMKRKVVIAGEPDDETSLLIKDGEGNIVKGVPIRTARPHRMEIQAHPHPQSKQLIVGQEYNITTTIYDKEDHVIYPSENILMKTTFGKQFDVLEITVNGVLARVVPEFVGVAKIRASLRSTLTPEDEETEIEPHVKATTDFEIYEGVLMSPKKTVLPWDSDMTMDYELSYKVSGGGKVYGYSVTPDHLATVDSEGKVKVVAGPGSITVTAGMSQSPHNNDTAIVHLLTPTSLSIPDYPVEWVANQTITIPVAIFTREPDSKEEIMYTDCADVNFEVTLSNNKDFSMQGKASKCQLN